MSTSPKEAPVLVAALPWNLPDMISIQVGCLKAFLAREGVDAMARHYYKDILHYIDRQELATIESRLVGDDIFGALLFPECKEALISRIDYQSQSEIDCEKVLPRIAEFIKDVVDDIVALEPGLLALTTTHMQFVASVLVAKEVKAKHQNVKIVLGGLALHGQPAKNILELFPFIDFIIEGEGETALLTLSRTLINNGCLRDVPQLIYRDGEAIQRQNRSETVNDLNSLPLPDYSDYFSEALAQKGAPDIVPRATLQTVRGCRWGKCSFCIEGLPSRGNFRAKRPERVAEEVEKLVSENGILDYVLSDPDAAFSGEAFAAIKDLGYDLKFMVEMSGLVKPDTFRNMIAAGVRVVQIGIESFAPRMLRIFNKGVSLTRYVELMRICRENEVRLIYNNIVDSPFETQQDLDEAVENMEKLMFFQPPRTSAFRVSVGSAIEANPEKYGIECLLPSPEVEGYPPDVAAGIGVFLSFNAGYGFKPQSTEGANRTRWYHTLDKWKAMWELKPMRKARRGHNMIRIEHRIGDYRYHLDIRNALEMDLLRYCHKTRTQDEIAKRFTHHTTEEREVAFKNLEAKQLLFSSENLTVATITC